MTTDRKSYMITHELWKKISHEFTEDQRQVMRNYVTGQSICPAATFIDLEQIELAYPGLSEKIQGVIAVYTESRGSGK